MAAPAPKLDLKMLVLPAMLFVSKKIDMKNEDNIKMAQMGLGAVAALLLTVHAIVYFLITSKKDDKKTIWVPPKPKPQLPFNLGPAPEPVKPEEFEKTTYREYELKLLKEHAQGIIFSLVIAMVMSFKFNIHMSLLMQCVTLPLNAVDSIVLKKYLLGMGKGNVYNEVFEAPTVESIAAAAALANGNGEEPRVVELPDDEDKDKKKKKDDKKEDKEEKKPANKKDD